MSISPVSFKSLMVFTLKDNKPKASVPDLVKMSFANNPKLKNYKLQNNIIHHDEKIDGTIHNAARNFAKTLDKKYKKSFYNDSKKVYLTEADFYVNPRDTEKRYFLTAASQKDEGNIHKTLIKSPAFYVARFYP
ncbi:MAG: hypothetical protein LUG16_02730 [Candidatus Gastranaerophilales bacterium]|nr:hypothetical protein [Candidatus Gastranaerophilales bacterium]